MWTVLVNVDIPCEGGLSLGRWILLGEVMHLGSWTVLVKVDCPCEGGLSLGRWTVPVNVDYL